MTNPLHLFEIISHLGKFLSPWLTPPEYPFKHTFSPHDLLSCTLVSHTWRQALLPFLWETFDEPAMHHIPTLTLSANSVYFRFIFSLPTAPRSIQTRFAPRALVELHLVYWYGRSLELASRSSGLRNLTWQGLNYSDQNPAALLRCIPPTLTTLSLAECWLHRTILVAILDKLPKLHTLRLANVNDTGGDGSGVCDPESVHFWPVRVLEMCPRMCEQQPQLVQDIARGCGRTVETVVLNAMMPYEELRMEVFVKYLPFARNIWDALRSSSSSLSSSSSAGAEGEASPVRQFIVQKDPAIETTGTFRLVFTEALQVRSLTATFGYVGSESELISHLRSHRATLEVLELVCKVGYLHTLSEFVAELQFATVASVFPALKSLLFKNGREPAVEWKKEK